MDDNLDAASSLVTVLELSGHAAVAVHEVRDGPEAALEWEAVLTDHDGKRHPFRGVNIVRVRAGKFEWVRAYFDPAAPLNPTE